MKKIIAILLSAIMLLSLTACVDDNDGGEVKLPSSGQISGGSNDATDPVSSPEQTEPSTEVTVEKQVIYEENGIRVTVTGLDLDNLFGPQLKCLIENESDKDVTVQTRSCSVNGLMVDTIFSCSVAAGKKANDGITVMSSSLEASGISIFKDIEFSLHIFDSNEWETIADSAPISITTSADPSYEQPLNNEGVVAYEDDSFKIVIQKLTSEDSFWGADVIVYIENNSTNNITVQTRDVSVNGFMMNPIFSANVSAGKKSFSSITFLDSELEENEITDITDMELIFHIFDSDEWDTILDTEIVTVAFE